MIIMILIKMMIHYNVNVYDITDHDNDDEMMQNERKKIE